MGAGAYSRLRVIKVLRGTPGFLHVRLKNGTRMEARRPYGAHNALPRQ